MLSLISSVLPARIVATKDLQESTASLLQPKAPKAGTKIFLERIRELCTIKVLGFHNKETTMYIYRETIILSAIGIVVGWVIGILLHDYILNVVPPDEVMFNPTIWIGAYIIPFVTISVVSFVLKYYVNHKLKNVDMLEALKSVD